MKKIPENYQPKAPEFSSHCQYSAMYLDTKSQVSILQPKECKCLDFVVFL